MLHEKRKDLESEKQKKLLMRLLNEVSAEQPDLYYQPTSAVARRIFERIRDKGGLITEDRALLDRLSERDIEVLLSLH